MSAHCVEGITNHDTIWSEFETVVLALLVLGREMCQLFSLESARTAGYALRIFWRYLEGETFMGRGGGRHKHTDS